MAEPTRFEYMRSLLEALDMLTRYFRGQRSSLDWSLFPLSVQTEAMHITYGIAARLGVRDPWKGPMSDSQRIDIAIALEDTAEAICCLDTVST